MTITPEEVGLRVRESNRNHTMRSARAKQQEEHRIGASEVGLCRSYLKYMTDGTEYDVRDAPDDKLAAFVGTAVGDLTETAYSASNPYAVVQASFVATLPSGKVIECHSDIIDPDINSLIDIKTKSGLELVIKDGKPSRQYQYQVAIYLLGAIQSKLLKPGARAFLCYIDRSGKDPRVVTYEVIVNEFTYQEIDEWIGEAMYSVEHDLPAPKDQEYNFCESYCLAAETEVVTRDGIFPIGSLAGTTQPVLAPAPHGTGMTGHGHWIDAPIRNYGVRALRTITLRRGKAHKTIRATPDHRWFVGEHKNGQWKNERVAETRELSAGDMLRDIRTNRKASILVPAGAAQGFVYGDGTRKNVSIYDAGSDKGQVAWLFEGCGNHRDDNLKADIYSGIPRLWKDEPPTEESTSFHLSWLAGYFAADGHIAKQGQAAISSAKYESIMAVRSSCAIAGVGYGPVITAMRKGFNDYETPLYSVTINTNDLPEWFWLRKSQRKRVVVKQDARHRRWVVENVEDLGDVEEVFCAEVPEVNAFALSDGILTHNCRFFSTCRGGESFAEGVIEDPEAASALTMRIESMAVIKEATARKDQADAVLKEHAITGGLILSDAGPYEISRTLVNGGHVSFDKADYYRLNVRKQKPAKPEKKTKA